MPARIVVVHDDPMFRDPLVASLEAHSHDVAAFDDAMLAWDALEAAQRVEILVTRVNFGPGKPHGVALARSARSRRPEVRVLIVGRPEHQTYADDAGLFLPMPISVPEVVEAIERTLSDGRPGTALAADHLAA